MILDYSRKLRMDLSKSEKLRRLASTLLIVIATWLATGILPGANAKTHAGKERLLKAVFIYNFAKFTRWPDDSSREENAPLTLCTIGQDSLTGALKQLKGKTIKGRPLIIQRLADEQVPDRCNMLYVATSKRKHYRDIIDPIRNQPILTISQLPGFARSGGIIKLYRRNNRIRFSINQGTARAAGLKLSSRLLRSATLIEHGDAR
jgi:hypothetical protein